MLTTVGTGDVLDIGFGIVGNARRISATGTNPSVNIAGTPADIWSGGGVYPWLAAATSLEIVSASANDAAAGTGANTVQVNALDIGYAEISFTVTLNGTTPVVFPRTIFRINSIAVMTAGTGGNNAGDLTIRNAGGGTTRALILAGTGQTQQSQFTVPAGWSLQVLSILLAYNRVNNTARSATFVYYTQFPNGVYRLSNEVSIVNSNAFMLDLRPGAVLPEKTDFGLRCTFVANDASNLSASFLGIMRKNT